MLVSTVELAWRARKAGELGIRGSEGIGLDWAAVIARKNRLVAEWSEGKAEALKEERIAVLQGLDKVTARISIIEAPVGEEVMFGRLGITPRTCLKTPPTEPPESAARMASLIPDRSDTNQS